MLHLIRALAPDLWKVGVSVPVSVPEDDALTGPRTCTLAHSVASSDTKYAILTASLGVDVTDNDQPVAPQHGFQRASSHLSEWGLRLIGPADRRIMAVLARVIPTHAMIRERIPGCPHGEC